ncbi:MULTISPECIES: acyl-CoA thioesterase [Olivibacter]|jgi:acyl-CoA thioester hydrolase/thioesterase-3|uniref:Acyl-CoA thioesterase n=2 Tax=Olivibacter TaxID=376469 RepID=A0ABV6HJ38_9SPHI|nr:MULTISPECIES: acyl-CoA thioesterase [Olivibacter]MCL4640352.1 acyl-CoA thioesterase [Olivibacter sp. UJ_SKK_5.1]MDM8174938.1 acyl-CoA thioesterase [Olivibacter sp. 47]MDX3913382.1 acyl-CoA thioesterase [Pseudosphingobacterium sp.]QEL01722.1 acyl-CoA thioesterase [Olivibacter sp. LS-1]
MINNYARFESEFKVRPDDIDMFQHVHNSKYFDYVLAARYEQMELFYGMTMEEFMEQGFGWVVRTAHVNYKRPLKLGQYFIVETGVDEMKDKGCVVTFAIKFKDSGKVSCDGWFDYALIDLKSGKSAFITEEMLEKYSI